MISVLNAFQILLIELEIQLNITNNVVLNSLVVRTQICFNVGREENYC